MSSADGGRRVAFACPRHVGNSVVRHRHVRKLREFYRHHKTLFAEGHLILIQVRKEIVDWGEVEGRLEKLLRAINA